MTQDFNSLRTTEDIINALNVLYFNLSEIERKYYDIFLNPKSMTVELQRYNDLGVLETIPVANLASLRSTALTGSGNPNGIVSAETGQFYVDTATYDLYYKSSGTDSYGWVLLWSGLNLIEGTNFLSPTGNGSQLTNLNMTNAGSGILSVARGGTGVGNITGLIKGNGTGAFTAAVDGVDYLGVGGSTGIICYYPVAKLPDGVTSAIPSGWLICDGSAYSRETYNRLFAKIGTTYGSGNGTTTFNVPNLMDDGDGNPFFIRCWDGSTAFNTVQPAQVGTHNHALSGNTGNESAHTHTSGTLTLEGSFSAGGGMYFTSPTGCFKGSGTGSYSQNWYGAPSYGTISIDNTSWSGETSGGSAHAHSLEGLSTANNTTDASGETRVLNKMMVPIIKY